MEPEHEPLEKQIYFVKSPFSMLVPLGDVCYLPQPKHDPPKCPEKSPKKTPSGSKRVVFSDVFPIAEGQNASQPRAQFGGFLFSFASLKVEH